MPLNTLPCIISPDTSLLIRFLKDIFNEKVFNSDSGLLIQKSSAASAENHIVHLGTNFSLAFDTFCVRAV